MIVVYLSSSVLNDLLWFMHGAACRWFKAENHRPRIAAQVESFQGVRDLHMLDAFGASQAMAWIGLVCLFLFDLENQRPMKTSGNVP